MKSNKSAGLFVLTALALMAFSSNALAWEKVASDVEYTGKNVYGVNSEVDIRGTFKVNETAVTATAAELNLLDGVTATPSELNAAADLSARVVSVSTTGATTTVTLSAATPIVVLSDGPAQTNIISIAQPYPVGQSFTLIAIHTATNLLRLADNSTTVALGANVDLGATDTLSLYAVATNRLVKTSSSDN